MNRLLARQVRKFLSQETKQHPEVTLLLDAVNSSYNNHDEHFQMLQRATALSSKELSAANESLRAKTREQESALDKMREIVGFFNIHMDGDARARKETDLLEVVKNQTQQLMELDQQRSVLLQKLERRNEELSNYAQIVSHDLKSPLRSIDTLSAWLSNEFDENMSEEGRGYLSLLRKNVEKMEGLIEGILQYASVGMDAIPPKEINLEELTRHVVEVLNPPERINIVIGRLPTVRGNETAFHQVLQNLIGNAIAYNEKEMGRISIQAVEHEDDWLISVEDNGRGIREEDTRTVFEPFRRVTNEGDGLGLGLALTKKIVQNMDGEIWVRSKPQVGTTFYFTIRKNL
ncbi:MAG: hypothetical protein KTR24_17485 [Saprospiraceae bacterium]|nr:hypothetical protein [Saprospiraceae bacterium]